jgi:hypothetical protein
MTDTDQTREERILCKKCGSGAKLERRGGHAFVVCGNPACGSVRKVSTDSDLRTGRSEPDGER